MKKFNEIYHQWLNSKKLSNDEIEIIKNYTKEEQEKYFKNKKFSFGTAGVRRKTGLSPQKLNIYTYRLLAKGYAEFIKKTKKNLSVIVVHDNRINGDRFAIAIAQVLKKNGLKVYLAPNNKSVPTPVLSFLIRKMNCGGGINVTASHNPPIYNGFKTYNSTGCQTNAIEEEIIIQNLPEVKEIFNVEFDNKNSFDTIPNDYLEQYFKTLSNILKNIKTDDTSIKALFSSHHGTSSQIMKTFANSLGFKNFEEYEPECNPTHLLNKDENTNPEEYESFNSTKKFADKNGINYIFAHDPDSDRSSVVEKQKDGSWYIFNGNEAGILFTDYLLKNAPKSENQYIISTHVTGNFIKKLTKNKINIYLTKTGFKNISLLVEEYEKTGNLVIAFEEAVGALLFPINREKDGFQQTALALKMISKYQKQGKTLKDRLNELFEEHGYWIGITDYHFSDKKDWKKIFNSKLKEFETHPIKNLFGFQIKSIFFNQLSDSLEWIMENDCWIKFRLSGTEPKFKIYYNLYGKDKLLLEKSLKEFREYFKKIFLF